MDHLDGWINGQHNKMDTVSSLRKELLQANQANTELEERLNLEKSKQESIKEVSLYCIYRYTYLYFRWSTVWINSIPKSS